MRVFWRVLKEAKAYKGLFLIAIFSTLAMTAVNLAAPSILTKAVSFLEEDVTKDSIYQVLILSGVLFLLYLSKILFRYLANFLSHKAAWNIVEQIRLTLYKKIQSFPLSFFHGTRTGDLMSRAINDTGTFEALYAHVIPECTANIVTLVGVVVILFVMNAKLALLTCIPVPLIVLSAWIFIKKVRPNFRLAQKSQAQLNAQLQDNFLGIQEIQAFSQQKAETEKVRRRAKDYTGSILRALKVSAVFHPSVEFLTSLGNVIIVAVGGLLAYKGEISPSYVVGFIFYLSLFYAPITGIAQLLENLQQALAGAERVIEILDTPVGIADKEGAKTITRAKGQLSFSHVDFSYQPDAPVLQDVSFTLNPGQMLAIVGPTGVGKSTLIRLIARFYEPNSGKITLDGEDVQSLTLQSLRAQIAFVLQDTYLFNGTIAENIAFACPGASKEEIFAAAKTARIHDEIEQMKDGYDTYIGERGVMLSGGQKQRLAIARAVLCKAPILVLDEATSAVDVETEALIQSAISELAGTHTIIAIAHRLSTIRRADNILVFEEGKIVESGTHETLLEKGGVYSHMCKIQNEGARI